MYASIHTQLFVVVKGFPHEPGRAAAAERGENPTVLARMRTGWAVTGDTQHLPGYCLLLYAGRANR